MIRNTRQRTEILKTVREMTNHPTAEQVLERVGQTHPEIGRATVYRVLAKLAEEGEILRVEIANAPDRFDFTLSKHAHCLCEKCGKVYDLPLEAFPKVSGNTDFLVERMNVTATGVCAGCR